LNKVKDKEIRANFDIKIENDIFKSPIMLPILANFGANMLLVFFYGNVDINSRVASTNPMYYWAFA